MSLSGKSNINPKIWGPNFWETIHFVAYGYPQEPNDLDKKTYLEFYENMMKVLPCDKCTNSAQKLFKMSEIDKFLNSKNDLIKWSYLFHKSVNNKLGKDSPTLEEFMHNFTTKHDQMFKLSVNSTIVFAIVIIILVLLFMRYTLDIL